MRCDSQDQKQQPVLRVKQLTINTYYESKSINYEC